ncbi:MAG: HD domain-containing protein [Bacteroidota bacterium]
MTQALYQKAIAFAGDKHKDQLVPGSQANYLLHVSNVAMEILMAYAHAQDFDVNLAVQMALLHDVIEDTDASFEELETHFEKRVANGVLALTKNTELGDKSAQMADSLNRINKLEKEVGMVKLADRITNLQAPPHYWSKEKIKRYHEEARIIADQLEGKNVYLNDRLRRQIESYTQYFT